MSFWTGLFLGNLMGVVATLGAEVVVACTAYAGFRLLVRLGLLEYKVVTEKLEGLE